MGLKAWKNWPVTSKYRTRQGQSWPLGECRRTGPQRHPDLWAFLRAAFATAPTGVQLLAWMGCGSDPLGHFSCYIYSPTQISWLLLDPKPSRRLKFRTSISALFWYSHTPRRSWMDVTFITHISGLSFFPLKCGLSFGSQPAAFRRQCCWAAVSCCTGTQYHLTDKKNNS